jgi:hypothetical protein
MEFFLATWAQDSEEADDAGADIPNRSLTLGLLFLGFMLALFSRTLT